MHRRKLLLLLSQLLLSEQGPHTVKLERNYDVETWRSDATPRHTAMYDGVAQFPVLSNQAGS